MRRAQNVTSGAARGTNRPTCSPTRMFSPRSHARATQGFRCIKVDRPEDLSSTLTASIDFPSRDLRTARPVSEAAFEAWRRLLYTFDHGDLHVKMESVDDSSREWRVEKVSYAAAYGDERVPAYMFLPKNAKPPYQVMVAFSGVECAFRALQRHYHRLTRPLQRSSFAAAVRCCTRSTRARSNVATLSKSDHSRYDKRLA